MNLKNFAVIEGRLTKDVELKTSTNGKANTFFSVAVDRNYKDANGEYGTDFIPVTAFGKTAEFISKHFKKGSAIQLLTEIRPRTYEEEKDGNKVTRSAISFVVTEANFPLLGKATGKSENTSETPAPTANSNEFAEIADDDDLPF